ncbi:hypothetical protein LJE72_20605 [Desulfosporosinus sp. SRJS8]|nr:HD domain-containing phosphohydrolase [Desulfosporosinus sp. SRJS8]MCB8817899.1 hypothetical protein [Desulfosporosinus sp. SRJS8]
MVRAIPLGLKEEEIPVECRIVAIADAYDAMTNNRPYRKAMSQEQAFQELNNHMGIQFDPRLVPISNSFGGICSPKYSV